MQSLLSLIYPFIPPSLVQQNSCINLRKGGSTVTLERQVFHGRLWIPSWPAHSAAQHRRAASGKATHAAGEPKAKKGIVQFSEKRSFEIAMFHWTWCICYLYSRGVAQSEFCSELERWWICYSHWNLPKCCFFYVFFGSGHLNQTQAVSFGRA